MNLLTSISALVDGENDSNDGNDTDGGSDSDSDGEDDSDANEDDSDSNEDDEENDSDGSNDNDTDSDNDSDQDNDIPQQLAAYWAGWTGETYKLYEDYVDLEMTTLYLSFADFVNGEIDTSVSGHLTDIPSAGSQMWPSYINWTRFAHFSPETKIILSLGGATFSGIWLGLDSAKIESIA